MRTNKIFSVLKIVILLFLSIFLIAIILNYWQLRDIKEALLSTDSLSVSGPYPRFSQSQMQKLDKYIKRGIFQHHIVNLLDAKENRVKECTLSIIPSLTFTAKRHKLIIVHKIQKLLKDDDWNVRFLAAESLRSEILKNIDVNNSIDRLQNAWIEEIENANGESVIVKCQMASSIICLIQRHAQNVSTKFKGNNDKIYKIGNNLDKYFAIAIMYKITEEKKYWYKLIESYRKCNNSSKKVIIIFFLKETKEPWVSMFVKDIMLQEKNLEIKKKLQEIVSSTH